MFDTLTQHWFTPDEGWSVGQASPQFPYADLLATNNENDLYVVCLADGGDPLDSISLALGRLALMMDRDVATNSFGLPERDLSLDPPLIRHVLAVPADDQSLAAVRRVPDRIRRLLNLIIVTVADDEVTKYLEGVAV